MSLENGGLGLLKSVWTSYVKKTSRDRTIPIKACWKQLTQWQVGVADEPHTAGVLSPLLNVLPKAVGFHKGGFGQPR